MEGLKYQYQECIKAPCLVGGIPRKSDVRSRVGSEIAQYSKVQYSKVERANGGGVGSTV